MSSTKLLTLVVTIALGLRVFVVVSQFEKLSVDTDAYLTIGGNINAGEGFCSVPNQPTAYRPPLYPLLVAGCLRCGGLATLAIVQVVAGTVTVILTWCLARAMNLPPAGAVFAAFLVACDPLLLDYTRQAMTETLATLLVTAFLLSRASNGSPVRRGIVSGILFGLSVLCRPSLWAYAALAVVVAGLRCIRPQADLPLESRPALVRRFLELTLIGAATLVVICPWFLRNWLILGHPIVTTTHGGYTMVLGNNDSFYQHVVRHPRGSIWPESAFREWRSGLEEQLSKRGIPPDDELARDRELNAIAIDWIESNPGAFLRSAALRIRWLWSPIPIAPRDVPLSIVWLIAAWYMMSLTLAFAGTICSRADTNLRTPCLMIVLSLTLLHTLYWANIRMRAPIIPAVALLAACGADCVYRFRALQKSASHVAQN